ncbi:unnamed protein product [Lymnaea stagnalis]|uniref:Uncharacterized protein n=1 Tax=Lymnaea stagnalis TaxID=6523 RepID=A0AAV2HLE7_LYMST
MNCSIVFFLVTLTFNSSCGQTDPTTPPETADCGGTLEQCQDDYGASPQKRKDLLALRQCVTDAPCDDSEDDTAEKERLLFVVNSNRFHWIPADDPGESKAAQTLCTSTLPIVIALLTMFKVTFT